MTNEFFGVIGTSEERDERHVSLHPDHLLRLEKSVRDHIIFVEGSGATFGIADAEIAMMSGGLASHRKFFRVFGRL